MPLFYLPTEVRILGGGGAGMACAERLDGQVREKLPHAVAFGRAMSVAPTTPPALALPRVSGEWPTPHTRVQCITQFSCQVLPSSRDEAWNQRHERGVIWSHTPR